MDTDQAEQLPPPTLDDQGQPVCCGDGSWGEKGKPLAPGCGVCRKSASNWRRTKE
jgi:hypothetical protein